MNKFLFLLLISEQRKKVQVKLEIRKRKFDFIMLANTQIATSKTSKLKRKFVDLAGFLFKM